MRSVELFGGAGGLALGMSAAGFSHDAFIERNKDACATVRENQRLGVEPLSHWPLFEADVTKFDYSFITPGVDVVTGGPPCQPFSLGGKHRGHQDERNMFPEAVRAVRELRPRAFIFENVRGLLRHSFATYFEYIILQLTYPTIVRKVDEEWRDHLSRLEQHHTCGENRDLHYNVVFQLLNAADYGVPQRRERVFIVGFRSDLNVGWSFPHPTHSQEALHWDQWVTGKYWDERNFAGDNLPTSPPRLSPRIASLRSKGLMPFTMPWRTVYDAIHDLPDPRDEHDGTSFLNHYYNPGARVYPGHTGSPLHEPAKTLKAGDHGVPGGENMLVYPSGEVRYFSVRESARLQTFPDEFVFDGCWSECMRQLGNAVPMKLGESVANAVHASLINLK
jgi:DNA (cytosine-5)-methyltransferase 1